MPYIGTEHLKMISFTLELVEATVKGADELSKVIPHKISNQWPMPDYAEILPWIAKRLQENPESSRWSGLIIHKKDNTIIGDMGCKGGPDANGIVEIGYSIVPDYQGKGYATEMVKGLVQWLLNQENITTIKAECLTSNTASARVLEKSGFCCVLQEDDMKYWILK